MIRDILDIGEQIVWEGKPDKVTYIAGAPIIYIFALLWGAFDSIFIFAFLNTGTLELGGMGLVIIPFFIFHLTPVWIAVGGPLYRTVNWKYIDYIITDRRIYIESGMIGRDVKIIEFSDVHEPEVNVGVIEKLRECGSIRLSPGVYSNNGGRRVTSTRTTLAHIADPYRVYKIIKQMALDIKSDILYPNALRPDENPGYDTKYRPD